MPQFLITSHGKQFQITAPDQDTAMKAFAQAMGSAAAPPGLSAGLGVAQGAPEQTAPAAADPLAPLKAVGDAGHAFQSGAMQGMTLGFGDEINAGLMTPIEMGIDAFQGKGFDPGRSFNQALAKNRALDTSEQAANPIAATAGDITGSLVTGGKLAEGGLTLMRAAQPTVASLASRGAVEGALYGAANGAGRSEGDLGGRLRDALIGGAGGAITGGTFGGIGGALAERAAVKAIPSVDELKDQAHQLYDAAEARGVTFPQPAVKQFADDVAANAISEGIDPTLHPRATAALQRLQQAGQTGMTVQDAQTLRRVIAAAGKDPMNPDEGRISGQMLDQLDNFVGGAAPELAAARGVYAQAKRGERIEQAVELAGSRAGQFSGSGFENALRTEFRGLERQIIKGQIKGLSQDEIAAITKVARGGPVENILRYVGKLAPTNVVSLGASGGMPFMIGNALGGPAAGAGAAATTMGAGLLARQLATSMTARNAAIAAAVARNGGKIAVQSLSPGIEAVTRALISSGGNVAGHVPAMMAFSTQ